MHNTHENEDHLELIWAPEVGLDGAEHMVAHWVVAHPGAPVTHHHAA